MEQKSIKQLKKGEFFTLKPCEEPKDSQVYIKGEYARDEKKYSCVKFNDVNSERLFDGKKIVYVGFTF